MIDDADQRLLKRFTTIKKTEYWIEESVYYRTHMDQFNDSKSVLWNTRDHCGSIKVYED